ncbi:MAG: hemolysin family protein [Cyclobacteriaceae bacterium]
MEAESSYAMDGAMIGLTVIFIILNGFFVAAEFALVKVRKSRLKAMVAEKRAFAETAMWLYKRQNLALSACQLGITMASLALGWIGEPAIAHLITPLIHDLGIESEAVIHGIAFTIAFTIITALHIVIGEQVPKIYAIRKPGIVFLGSAALLKGFYVLLYPFMYGLDNITTIILRWLGIEASGEHETALTEDEIRASLSIAHAKGELSANEHRLLDAVFKFDDEVARKIMIPRNEVEFLDINNSFAENLQLAKRSNHSRFPLCDGSLDKLIGVVHIKSMVGIDDDQAPDLDSIKITPMLIPENMLLGKLLHEFRASRKHLAFIQEEHGTILGIVTLEDVLEELVGNVQDEFDNDQPEIVEQSSGKYLLDGDVQIDEINSKFNIDLFAEDADTISGLIVEKFGHKLKVGKIFNLSEGVDVEIVSIDGIRATKIRLSISQVTTASN